MVGAAREAAERITRSIAGGEAPAGAFRVFGDWFGRPYDNQHRPTSADASATCLTVRFDGGETLQVWEPGDVTVTASELRIGRAVRVRWEWFYYGLEQTPENRFAREHWVEDGRVRASSTATWHRPSLRPSLEHPAVQLR